MTTRGERLSRFLLERTGGRRGWQAALVAESGVKRQTITKWTGPTYDGYPQLEHLAAVAKALGVRLSEIVAAMQGEAAQGDPLADRVERLEATVERLEAEGGADSSRLQRRSA